MTSLIRWAHPVPLEPFRIAKHCVTNREFAAFVLAGGYADESFWSFDGVPASAHHGAFPHRYAAYLEMVASGRAQLPQPQGHVHPSTHGDARRGLELLGILRNGQVRD